MDLNASSPGLDLLLGAFAAEQFFADHWEKSALHLRHADPGRFAHLISVESFLETEIRRCGGLKACTRDAQGWHQEIAIEPDQAAKLFRAGMTICASALAERSPCGEVIRAFRAAVSSAALPQINCYYSPAEQGFGLHFDTHPVWILQVAGRKHWTVSREPGVRDPLCNVVYPPGRDLVKLPWITLERPDVTDPRRFMEVLLEPGDVLYLPAGCWHAARAEGSSLALSLALGRVSTMDLVSALLEQALTRRLSPRLPAFPAHQEAPLRARLEADLAQIKDAVHHLDVDALMNEHRRAAGASR